MISNSLKSLFLRLASSAFDVVHGTDTESARSIRENGFSLDNFGRTSKMTGSSLGEHDPLGIFFIRDVGHKLIGNPPHPWDFNKQGEWVFATVVLENPLETETFIEFPDGSWKTGKQAISEKYGNATGSELTQKLIEDGFDGIVTVTEIIVFDPSKIKIK